MVFKQYFAFLSHQQPVYLPAANLPETDYEGADIWLPHVPETSDAHLLCCISNMPWADEIPDNHIQPW